MEGGNVVIVFSYCHFFSSISVSSICVHSPLSVQLLNSNTWGEGWAGPRLAISRDSTVQCVDIQTGFNRTILRRRQNKYNDLGLKLNILDYQTRLRAVLPFAKATQKISISIVHPHCPSCTIAEAACIACRSKLQISPVRDTFHRDMWRQRDSDGGVYITTHNILYVDICQAARKQQKSDVKRATELLF